MMESIGSFPPRFVVTYSRTHPNVLLNSKVIISAGARVMTFQVNDNSNTQKGKCYCIKIIMLVSMLPC